MSLIYINAMKNYLLLLLALFPLAAFQPTPPVKAILLKDVTLIDGNGGAPAEHTDILIKDGKIAATGRNIPAGGATVIDGKGKTVMPAITSSHVHIGMMKGNDNNSDPYTRENILSQLKKYADYGITNILVMGSDQPMLFTSGLRDSSVNGLLPGARLFSAGYGFAAAQGGPPMKYVYHPATVTQATAQLDSVSLVKPTVIKMWVDDFGGSTPKMDPAIYKALITRAHTHHIPVASHLYYLADAKNLVASGLDIIAHSIRDQEIDAALLQQMKAKGIIYIPTLSLDEYAYIYARKPEWINDPFFKASLEPGVYEMITSPAYQDKLKNSPSYQRNLHAFETAMKNVKRIADAGIIVALGTDSGAQPVRTQGFSEHLEMELLVQAGLTPLQAITIATKNAAAALKIDRHYGTIEKGKTADLIILDANPAQDIKNTRKIAAVYKAGEEVSKGPLQP
ncbi:amidohydrolase family protein [Chitinophaga ginsengisegetis]|uniref:amidohydrolase family protein n=2 Tax=Chitinophaga ginsengisegetis TaxID=393003 RepID=UPI000DBFEEB8|nr:amidohydrolase family protein [Chitinophaga ginsengisegetis]MDR6568593.1 imidazolonepropionase-like amidohydrolase [Chitinophaga ginsengisegetis]